METKMENDNKTNYELKEARIKLVLNENAGIFSSEPINSPEKAIELMGSFLKDMDREMFCVVNLDNMLIPLNYNVVTVGTLTQSFVSVQNVFKSAILSNARSIIVLHNHPSGITTPSMDDIATTRKLCEVGKLMDIPLQDHIIVGAVNGEVYSMRNDLNDLFTDALDMRVIKELQKEKSFQSEVMEATAKQKAERTAVDSKRTSRGKSIPEK